MLFGMSFGMLYRDRRFAANGVAFSPWSCPLPFPLAVARAVRSTREGKGKEARRVNPCRGVFFFFWGGGCVWMCVWGGIAKKHRVLLKYGYISFPITVDDGWVPFLILSQKVMFWFTDCYR